MTYLGFHLVFTVPVIAALWVVRPRVREPWWPLATLVTIAFVYTTPWDNHLVAQGVWTYPPDRVLATVGHVPVEEYAFFVLQTVLTGLAFMGLRARFFPAVPAPVSRRVRPVGVAVFGAVSLVGAVLTWQGGSGLYLGLLLAWAGPILTFMWAVGGEMLWARRRLVGWAVALPTLYLCLADRVAIELGVWSLTEATRTGVELAGLPLEEALFFLLTNMMVVNGLALCEPSPASVLPAMRREAARRAGTETFVPRARRPRRAVPVPALADA